jgi:hypothetical protein
MISRLIGPLFRVQWKFEPRDLWIGVYWTKTVTDMGPNLYVEWDVYICWIPTLPLHIRWGYAR